MSDLDTITDNWVLRAKVEQYEKALAASEATARAAENDTRAMAVEFYRLKDGVRGFALTLRSWAVAAGGHTPSAIIASRLLQLIGDEKAPQMGEAEVAMAAQEAK